MNPFQKKHLFQALTLWESSQVPADYFCKKYFQKNRSLGSTDRKVLLDFFYQLIRWKELLDAFIEPPITWEKRWEVLQNDPWASSHFTCLPKSTQVGFTSFLFQKLEQEYGLEKAQEIAKVLQTKAPVTVRANLQKISPKKLFSLFCEKNLSCQISDTFPYAITFKGNISLLSLSEFQEGLFEVQDESSQQAAFLIPVKPGSFVLDYCAGSGGKSLALASLMDNQGHLFLYDIRKKSLYQAEKRFLRAGIKNYTLLLSPPTQLKNQMDFVILDVPCSGSGTLRRKPEQKEKITATLLQELVQKQRAIFEEALPFVKKGGSLFYMTCSLLQEENEKQIDYFKKVFPIDQAGPFHKWLPLENGGDGFFAVELLKK